MKNNFTLSFLFCLHVLLCYSQAGQWTWMGGAQGAAPSQGNYGIIGVPNPNNQPPGNYEAVYWTDLEGNFWIFGGQFQGLHYNDLWKYNPVTNMWTWMGGSAGVFDEPGVYGTMGIPSSLNKPGSRSWGVVSWTDNNGDLWMYSGFGIDEMGVTGYLSDLWRYNIATNQWTWMKGDKLADMAGNYGIKTIPNVNNLPPGRAETKAYWKDKLGKFWFFGGNILSDLNDLWKYDPSNNIFTWMKGSNLINDPGHSGIMGIPDPMNYPSSRCSYSASMDIDGNLLLFGGFNVSAIGGLMDIWKYNINDNVWTWINGNVIPGDTGNYTIMCKENDNNRPGGRLENRSWPDSCGNIINFGGFRNMTVYETYNDLYYYDLNSQKWIWIDGSNDTNPTENYGIKGVMSVNNKIPSRGGSCVWKDTKGDLWTFGGWGIYIYNDLWKYHIIDSLCLPKNCYKPKNPINNNIDTLILDAFVPNIFTPNGDGVNDQFLITAGGFTTYHLIIYNRWGSKVFESNDSQTHWNGRINNTGNFASDGTYFYILQLTNSKNESKSFKGFLTLIKEKSP